jgi:hypothetical protein
MVSIVAHPATKDNALPARLSKSFIWFTAGTKHANYSPTESFQGDTVIVGKGHLGCGSFGSVDAVVCKSQVLARKHMHFSRLDKECRREAEILEVILH